MEDEVLSLVVLVGCDAILDLEGVGNRKGCSQRSMSAHWYQVSTPRGDLRACIVPQVQFRGLSLVSTESEGDNAALLLFVSAGAR